MCEKKTLRYSILLQRRSLLPEYIEAASSRVVEAVKQRDDFLSATVVALYVSHQNEAPTDALIEWLLGKSKTVILPVVRHASMAFYQYHPAGMLKNRYGIYEPNPSIAAKVDLSACDLVVVPGIAFDRQGGRVGRGGGFYDRALSQLSVAKSPRRVGLAYDFQMVDVCPMDVHDVSMDDVIVIPSS